MTTRPFPQIHFNGTAVALTALAIGFNLPFALLSARFDYPGILRSPPEEILTRFAEGGPVLILIWYLFALAALALVPVGMLHALSAGRIARQPALAVAAAVAAALAGVTQAMGLLRWVLVVPELAATGDVESFRLIHAFGGTLVGEHLGQLLMALHVGLMAALQWREVTRWLSALASAVAGLLVVGALEGPVLALGGNGAIFANAAVLAYLGLTLWLLASAWGLLRQR